MARWYSPRRWLTSISTRWLTKPLTAYELRVPNDIENLKKTLRKADVVLVEGDQRVSQVIRYLTQSSWSHSAIYVGDDLLNERHGRSREMRERFGEEARHLLVEAVVGEGVIASPISKYVGYNIRICRPEGLRREDVDTVLAEVIGRIGDGYNVRHIYALARYLFPLSLIPRRWRRKAPRFGDGNEHTVICSTMIARAFNQVGYPILPRVLPSQASSPPPIWRRLLFRNARKLRARFRSCDPDLITPRSFDLSPYFEIVKFNQLGEHGFSYRDIVWDKEDARPG